MVRSGKARVPLCLVKRLGGRRCRGSWVVVRRRITRQAAGDFAFEGAWPLCGSCWLILRSCCGAAVTARWPELLAVCGRAGGGSVRLAGVAGEPNRTGPTAQPRDPQVRDLAHRSHRLSGALPVVGRMLRSSAPSVSAVQVSQQGVELVDRAHTLRRQARPPPTTRTPRCHHPPQRGPRDSASITSAPRQTRAVAAVSRRVRRARPDDSPGPWRSPPPSQTAQPSPAAADYRCVRGRVHRRCGSTCGDPLQ